MINVRENRMKNGESRETDNSVYARHKTIENIKTQHNMYWAPLVNKTWTLLQTTGGKDEPKLVFIRNYWRQTSIS
jgi:hypothetical protein